MYIKNKHKKNKANIFNSLKSTVQSNSGIQEWHTGNFKVYVFINVLKLRREYKNMN